MKTILVLTLCILTLATYLLAKTSGSVKIGMFLLLYALIFCVLIFTKLSVSDMGLITESIGKGVRFALPFVIAIFIGGLIVFFVSPEIFRDERYNLTLGKTLISAFITIPLFTVIIEELVFRGVLLGVLNNLTSQLTAIIISSLLFGLWHYYSAQAVEISFLSNYKILSALSVIIVTTMAGAFFAWLRYKGGSIVTPILVHWAFNSTGVVLAYLAWR